MRQPAVADRFYSGSPKKLEQEVHNLFAGCAPASRETAFGIICPHAGYIYSGGLAAKTISAVRIPETVIILGPNHHGRGAAVALSTIPWQMPFGVIEIDAETAQLLLAEDASIQVDETAHAFEHSLEVQIPLLHHLQPNLKIVPLVISHLAPEQCASLGAAIGRAIRKAGKKILLLASSDMNHYESRQQTETKDHQALQAILDLNPDLLVQTVLQQRISMCGVIPAAVLLHAAIFLGATSADLVGHTDSGYVNGDTRQVVGYAGVVIH